MVGNNEGVEVLFRGAQGEEKFGPGWCYLESFTKPVEAAKQLGFAPQLENWLQHNEDESEEDEFGDWAFCLPDSPQVNVAWRGQPAIALEECTVEGQVVALHCKPSVNSLPFTDWQLVSRHYGAGLSVGARLSELIERSGEISGAVEAYATGAIEATNGLSEDAAENYSRLGDYIEKLYEDGGFQNVTRSKFEVVTQGIVSRWAGAKEAVASAKLAGHLIFGYENWSPGIIEEAMDVDEDEVDKQTRLLRMCGMVFGGRVHESLSTRRRRAKFNAWRSDVLAPARTFCKVIGVEQDQVDAAVDRGIAKAVPMLQWAAATLGAAAVPALKVMGTLAVGGAATAATVVAAGVIMDWYYADKASQRLGPERESVTWGFSQLNYINRVREMYVVGAALSDEAYDCTTHTQAFRIDPFFFSVQKDLSRLKDDTAAQRSLTNALIPPLLQSITTQNKTVVMLPGSISEESARHIQEAMPEFYFRIVNRNHSHPELWAVRRGFEMMVARQVVTGATPNVVMVGGNVRQVSKIPGVIANYGPVITGRDDFRHDMKGTVAQRNFFRQVNIPEKFGSSLKRFDKVTGCAFYSTQDMHKEEYLRVAIACGIRKHYVAMNIPVVMMDHRITRWDDTILNCRYVKRGDTLSMTPLALPVAGYNNSFNAVMSWVKPHKPFLGYDVTVSALCQVGSSYLLEIDIGAGPQEAYDTIWKMPDAGYYVLHDLTRDSDDFKYFTVPTGKFDQVVKFVIQLSGAKNIMEATAGRILGLEAQIKIGGVVLERSWQMTHREFSSVMVHAIMCANLDKADTVAMFGKLRGHFSEFSQRSWIERAKRGYVKLLGWQQDDRKPGKARRGASDFDPVTHWTSRQPSGEGFAEPFRPALKRKNFAENCTEGDSHKRAKESGATRPSDEGYVSTEDLNQDEVNDLSDAEDDKDDTREGFIGKIFRSFRPREGKTSGVASGFSGFKANSATRQLVIGVDEVADIMTEAAFNPAGQPEFGTAVGSKSNNVFYERYASMDDFSKAVDTAIEFPVPDTGAIPLLDVMVRKERKTIFSPVGLHRQGPMLSPTNFIEEVQQKFFDEVGDNDQLAVPQALLDGIAGSAKSSVVKGLARLGFSTAIVSPTRTLARAWRKDRVGTCVTKHKLTLGTLRGRELLVIDEVYAYTKAELHGLLWKANAAQVKVVLIGDRKQQYEDGAEISFNDLTTLGMSTMRFCVSNTMPVDAVKIARWASTSDAYGDMFQTRSKIVHSILVRQKDQLVDKDEVLAAVSADNCLVFKDRLGPELQYETITDEQMGFAKGKEDEWLSVSRTQGLRTEHSLLLTSRFVQAEKWLSDQPGLFYVAVSRHSATMLCMLDQYDLSRFVGIAFENQVTVEGRLAMLQAREKFAAPMFVLDAKIPKQSQILSKLQQRGGLPQVIKFRAVGPILEDWRPWHKFSHFGSETSREIFKVTALRLVGDNVPYASTDAVKKPVYQPAMGLYSIRRPMLFENAGLSTMFKGLDRLAVSQNSKDELLDQKNVIERTARPRIISSNKLQIAMQADALFKQFVSNFLRDDELHLSTQPSAEDWADSRTSEFANKLETSDPYGVTAFSTRSQGFLKTQIKVKLKRTFAAEENYGQTVLASPADFNAIFGPWSKLLLRNLRLLSRPGLILDTGYSDKEVAREFRMNGVQTRFHFENYQADVKRQDTSHTPVTLRVFVKLMEYCGVPSELCDLYEFHSAKYEYQSMHAGLYRGEARYNLGSGDPFTLIRNIVEVLTVMLERFGDQLSDVNMIVKGDDYLSDKIMRLLPVSVPEVRATQLTEDFNKPPYHAGRFFLQDDVVPDPVRMISKILVKQSNSMERVNQLAESFYDRYVHLTDYSYEVMRKYVVAAYSDFEPELPLAALDLYHAMRDRNLFFDLLCGDMAEGQEKLVVLNSEEDCIHFAASKFTTDSTFLNSLRNETVDIVEMRLCQHGIPNFRVKGRPNDFLKRGVWLTNDHAWAVVGLTEFNEEENSQC